MGNSRRIQRSVQLATDVDRLHQIGLSAAERPALVAGRKAADEALARRRAEAIEAIRLNARTLHAARA